MGRSDIKTWLPLDDFAKIIGLDPLGFNQLSSPSLQRNTVCGDVFFQHAWQHSDGVGRDDIAMAIQQAEQEISKEVGFNLVPDWTIEERKDYPQPATPELYGGWGINARWQLKSVELSKGHVISGGVKTKSVIQAGVTFTRSDVDVDGFQETCTLTIPTSVTDANEIRLYYPAKNGSDAWEIRPITVSFSGANVIIQFKIWQVVAANQQEALDAQALDADNANTYETTVDVYRVYNDPATQAQMLWEGQPGYGGCGSCVACQLSSQAACFHTRDPRLGLVVPSPATWDSSEQEFTQMEYSVCREPDFVRFWYWSGYQDLSLDRPKVDMSPYWKYAVAYFAASKFERPICGCSNVNQFIEKWRRDYAYAEEQGSFTMTPEQASNRLGTSMGAFYAWRRINQNGVRILK